MRILIAEDDQVLADGGFAARGAGYAVDQVRAAWRPTPRSMPIRSTC